MKYPISTPGAPRCDRCRWEQHDFDQLDSRAYAYLLGLYLGDGCVTANGPSWSLRISLDTSYPGIIDECAQTIRSVCGRPPHVYPHHQTNCVNVTSFWKPWPCFLPQHGPGRKHQRKIELVDWQQRIVDAEPGQFLRGLIHTDGWRGLNKVNVKGKDYAYPRYQFSNRSDDIRKLFTDTCDTLGIEWSPWTRYHVSVARRDSVALMDTFVGTKY